MKLHQLFEVAAKLPIPVAHTFSKVGEQQKQIATTVKGLCDLLGNNGLVCGLLKHTNTLLHTLTKNMIDQDFSHGEFKQQVIFLQRVLDNPEKLENDLKDHITDHYKKGTVSFSEYEERIDSFFAEIAKEHRKLPAYNMLQRWCKEFGEQVGKKDFQAAKVTINMISQHVDTPEKLHAVAADHHLKSDGQLAEI